MWIERREKAGGEVDAMIEGEKLKAWPISRGRSSGKPRHEARAESSATSSHLIPHQLDPVGQLSG